MKQRILNWLATTLTALTGLAATHESSTATTAVEQLTLDQALELAERRHPQLAEVRALVEAAAGRAQQAGAFPNPEAIAGAQQLPLAGGQSNQREYVAGLGQTIPLGGRLGQARAAEQLEAEVRQRGLEAARRDLRKRVHGAFATALYQERAFQMQSQIATHLENLVALTQARLAAGDAAPEDLARAELERARAAVEARRSQSLREQALLALAAAIGDPALNVKSLAGNLETTFEIPSLEALAANLAANPELLEAEARARAGAARVALAKAERIPDLKLEALYHRLEGTKENTLDLGVSIPLPLFNRNQGQLREARAEAAAAEARSQWTRNELTARLREAHAQLTAALAGARAFQTEILPRADSVLQAAEARLAAGEASLADVLPVRRDWAAVRLSHLESLRDVMRAWAEVSAFLAAPGP